MPIIQRMPVPFSYSDSLESSLLMWQPGLPWEQRFDPILGYPLQSVSPTPVGTRPFAIICMHGHGGDGQQFSMGAYAYSPGSHAAALADAGFVIFAIRGGGPTQWGNAKAVARMLEAYNYLVGVLGCAPKVGLMGWSMGGIACMNFLRRYPDLVAAANLWVPALDLDYFNSTSGWSPPGGASLPNDGTWTAEISGSGGGYNPTTIISADTTIPGAGNTTIDLPVADGSNFADGYGALFSPRANIGGVWFTYRGSSQKALLGCTSLGAPIVATSGQTVATAYMWQTGDYGGDYSPQKYPMHWQGLGVPVRFNLASDDTTIPPSQADYFLSHVGDSNYALRSGGKVTGGHTGVFNNVPLQETVAFFQGMVGAPQMVGGTLAVRGGSWNDSVHDSASWADLSTRYASWAALAAAKTRWVSV